jgi:hypothetical protein
VPEGVISILIIRIINDARINGLIQTIVTVGERNREVNAAVAIVECIGTILLFPGNSYKFHASVVNITR